MSLISIFADPESIAGITMDTWHDLDSGPNGIGHDVIILTELALRHTKFPPPGENWKQDLSKQCEVAYLRAAKKFFELVLEILEHSKCLDLNRRYDVHEIDFLSPQTLTITLKERIDG